MANVTTLLDLESMMDDDLDCIEETPDYCQPPGGDYRIITRKAKITSFTGEDDVEVQSIQLTLAVVETLELATDEEPPVADGSLFTLKFQGTSEGVGTFKKEVRKMAGLETSKGINLRSAFELIESGLAFNGRLSYSNYKGRDGQPRTSLKMRVIPSSN